MNHFFTLLLAASCLTAVGQSDYNPDANGDGAIGSADFIIKPSSTCDWDPFI